MVPEPIGVRPTKHCLGDLGAELPDLGVRLEEIDDPVIVSAQTVPEQRDAGGAERVVALPTASGSRSRPAAIALP